MFISLSLSLLIFLMFISRFISPCYIMPIFNHKHQLLLAITLKAVHITALYNLTQLTATVNHLNFTSVNNISKPITARVATILHTLRLA